MNVNTGLAGTADARNEFPLLEKKFRKTHWKASRLTGQERSAAGNHHQEKAACKQNMHDPCCETYL